MVDLDVFQSSLFLYASPFSWRLSNIVLGSCSLHCNIAIFLISFFSIIEESKERKRKIIIDLNFIHDDHSCECHISYNL